MQTKLVPAIAAAVIGQACSSALPSQAPRRAPARRRRRRRSVAARCASTSPPPTSEFLDPALSYDAPGWQVLYMTNLMLLNYPDKPAPEGSRLVPDAAAGFRASRATGRTYTFAIKSGLRFSDGSAATTAAFKRAFERAASPQQGSPAIAFMHDVVGADERNEGKAGSVAGVAASRQRR